METMITSLLETTSAEAPSTGCQMCFAVDYDANSCPLSPSRYVCGNESSLGQLQCLMPFNLEKEGYFYGSYGVFVYGVVTPLIVLVTLVTNVLVVAVLCRPNMRTPTNVILANMAVADMLTGLWPLPPFMYFYSLGNYDELVPYSWCFTYGLFAELLPLMCHTASIWLTVALATQRYIYVCHPFKAKTWCTMRNAVIGTVGIYVAAILTVLPRYFDTVYLPVHAPSLRQPSVTMETCVKQFTCAVYGHLNIYFPITLVFRVFAIHLLPCVWLVVINALLVVTMRRAQERRNLLLKQRRQSDGVNGCRQHDNNKTTYMLIVVVGLFLVVELPLSVSLLIVTLQEMFGFTIQSSETSALMSLFLNLVILLSYPLNFFIYCAMSSQFRDTFRALFTSNGTGTGASSRSSSTHRQASSRLGVGRGSSQHQAGGGGVGGGNSSQYVCLQDSDTPLVGGRGSSRTNVTLV